MQEISNQNTDNNKGLDFNQQMLTGSKALPVKLDLEKLEDKQHIMYVMMTNYVEQVKINQRAFIINREWYQRLLGLHPGLTSDEIAPILYRDPWMGFTNFLVMGLDWDFLMLNALLVTFIDVVARDDPKVMSTTVLGVLVAYILDHMLLWLRAFLGRRNVARQTLSDERFLI